MIILQWCKTQIMCLLILIYVGITYVREGNNLNRITKKSNCNHIFDLIFLVSELAVFFDGVTACTVNFLDQIPRRINLLAHWGMYVSYEIYVALLFWYWVSVTVGIPKKKWTRAAYILPSLVAICLTSFFMPDIQFIQGKYTNYSMGAAVYVCFISVAIYCVLTIAIIVSQYRYIPRKKRKSLATTLVFIIIIMSLQIIFKEALLSCIALMMVTISIYINMENPAIHGLEHYHHEKWNGKGYPDGLGGLDIPLCARIMAVADVFDAVSAKRCYRDAMPLEECYKIILNGRGEDFDPDIVDAFMMDTDKVEEIYYNKVHM